MNHLTEEDLVLLYYNEPGVSNTHLNECAVCRAAAESLAHTLDLCDDWTVPEPRRDFYPDKWDRRFRLSMPSLKVAFAALAVAAMLVVAFTAGRVTKPARPAITAGLSKEARDRILEISLADHLDRAGMLLTEVSNSDTPDLSLERTRAQDLIEEGRLMRQALATQGETVTLSTLDEVERVMLEIANAPERVVPQQIEQLRLRIQGGSLIFKVKIIESNLRTEGQKS